MNAAHTNKENEFIEIVQCTHGPFTGEHVLVLHDDPPGTAKAYHLIDRSTAYWLMLHLSNLYPDQYRMLQENSREDAVWPQ